jgi:hypothetical protein
LIHQFVGEGTLDDSDEGISYILYGPGLVQSLVSGTAADINLDISCASNFVYWPDFASPPLRSVCATNDGPSIVASPFQRKVIEELDKIIDFPGVLDQVDYSKLIAQSGSDRFRLGSPAGGKGNRKSQMMNSNKMEPSTFSWPTMTSFLRSAASSSISISPLNSAVSTVALKDHSLTIGERFNYSTAVLTLEYQALRDPHVLGLTNWSDDLLDVYDDFDNARTALTHCLRAQESFQNRFSEWMSRLTCERHSRKLVYLDHGQEVDLHSEIAKMRSEFFPPEPTYAKASFEIMNDSQRPQSLPKRK